MAETASFPTRLIAFDTGPLLCFGGMPGGVRFIRRRYHQRMRWTEAVANEIAHHAQRPSSSRRNVELVEAAKPWIGRDRSALGEPHVCEDRAEVDKMRDLVRAAQREPSVGDTDLGESETLVFAQETASVALIDENPARTVADDLGIRAHSTVDVLIAALQEETITRVELRSMWEQLSDKGLTGGLVLPMDRGQLKRWPTPAPR